MPKYKITEVDNTGSLTLSEQPNIVYIPGGASAKTEPILCESRADLENIEGLNEDASYLLAKRLLNLGMQVLYQGFELTGNEASISSGSFTIDGVSYLISGNTVTWNGGSSNIASNGVATLKDGLKAKIGTESVQYPVAIATLTTPMYYDIEASKDKFKINEVEYAIESNNQVSWSGTGSPALVVNGKTTLEDGMPAEIDYVHRQVTYENVVAVEGAIAISDDDWEELEDKNKYNVRFLSTGAYACPSESMLLCAQHRGDCIALIDHAKPTTYDVDAIREAFAPYQSKYAAGFTPWFTANFEDTEVEVPASFGYLLAYARSIQSNPLWKAVAGVFRGRIPEMVEPSYKYTSAQCDKLQGRAKELDGPGDNGTYAVNPICYRRYSGFAGGFNYVLNGNRTLLMPGEKGIQASNFLNVRALISEISKTLYDASVTYTFEQNSDVLWNNFTALITPMLDKMQSGEGIAGYRLDRIATNKRARLCARLTIVPIEAVEDFELEIYLEDSLDASLEVIG